MNKLFTLLTLTLVVTWLGQAHAVEVPPASAEFRAQIAEEYMASCVQGIEAKPHLRATYSAKTVETYCACRQRYRADVLAQAIKNNARGQAVDDQAADYAQEKCVHILLNHLERE